jgi:hypothetical protein
MNSSGHRANILGDYNYVGVGVASDGDVLWVTVIFMRKGAAPEPTTTTTTTTAAPATTTTTTTIAAPDATTTTNPPAPDPVAESTTTTTSAAATTNPTGNLASDQPAEAPFGAVPVPAPSVEMQISSQALHLPIAD